MPKLSSAADLFNKYAESYQEKYMDVALYAASLDLFCAHLPDEHAQILELACGPGNVTLYLLGKRPDLKILGTDLAPNMIELARKNNPSAQFEVLDCRQISSLGRTFDAIMFGFGLPYLSKSEALDFIRDAAKLLKPKGLIYLSTMEDDYSKSGIQTSSGGDQLYMYFHEADYLVQALGENGFHLIALNRQEFPTEKTEKTMDLLILARLSDF